jgi:hypothetical protein
MFPPGCWRARCLREAAHKRHACDRGVRGADGGSVPDGGVLDDGCALDDGGAPDSSAASDSSVVPDGSAAPDSRAAPDSAVADGGRVVCTQPSPEGVWANLPPANAPSNVQVIAPNEIWGTALQRVARWDGSGWVVMGPPFIWADTFAGVVGGVAADDVWLTNGGTNIARWNGSTWTSVTSPSAASGSHITRMRVLGPRDVWIVSNLSETVPPVGSVEQSTIFHWDGSAWAEVAIPLEAGVVATLTDLWADAPVDVWVSGQVLNSAGQFGPIVLHWDGMALRRISLGPFPVDNISLRSIWASSAHDVWVGGYAGVVSTMFHYDGTDWTETSVPGVDAVWGSCSTSVWAVGSDTVSHYDGVSWSTVNTTLLFPSTVTGSGPDDVWIGGTDRTGPRVMRRQLPACGDGVLSPGEECDPPRALAAGGMPACDPTCHIPTCGNLAIDPGEACDPPDDSICDPQCQNIPLVCGNGIVQPGESCEWSALTLCQACQYTPCGLCFAQRGASSVCGGLSGADLVACNGLVGCLGGIAFSSLCAGFGELSALACYCQMASPCQPINGPCRASFEALAHSTDPSEVVRQINAPNSVFKQAGIAASRMSTLGCGPICAGIVH